MIDRTRMDALDRWCLRAIERVRAEARSQLRAADSYIHSVTFNRHDSESSSVCRSQAAKFRRRAIELLALADDWEANGIPERFSHLIPDFCI